MRVPWKKTYLDGNNFMNENPAQSNEPETDPMEARNVALQILSTVLDKHIMLDTALETSNGFMDLPTPRDRAFTRMIVTTALRRLGQIDDLIRKASSNPGKEISPPLLKHILRIEHVLSYVCSSFLFWQTILRKMQMLKLRFQTLEAIPISPFCSKTFFSHWIF